MFEMPPYAQKDQGVFVAFAKTIRENDRWKSEMDSDGASRLSFNSCDNDTCTAVVPAGKVQAGKDAHEMDLLDKFLHSDHLMLLYMSKGHPYRTMVFLSSFQKEYQRVLREEFDATSEQPK